MADEKSSSLAKKEIDAAYAAILGGEDVPEFADADMLARAIAQRIMEAETFEEVFEPQELDSWSDHLGTPVKVIDFRFNKSSFEDGKGPSIYAVCDLLLPDGQIVTVSTGARNVLVQL